MNQMANVAPLLKESTYAALSNRIKRDIILLKGKNKINEGVVCTAKYKRRKYKMKKE
jgi:hypothetical protein